MKKQLEDQAIKLSRQAVPTGFEPAISALTGPHVRPLHHGTIYSNKRAEFIIRNYECQYESRELSRSNC